ncbi:DMT family transporter [Sphingomonas naphthae]|uniref:DMT family transporter n=1 Tax=Sphingomonas naphthae TaxID=1813468 RepID=A0ABY7TQD8_9SPHN|nr:DMT family transporter [Sphingomonas naphthae]WCT75455.1 DMT family transporter [Sphingomonas naphthae]
MPKPASLPTAFGVALLGIALFSAMDAVVKGSSFAIGVYNTLLWRSVAGVVLAGALHFGRRPRWPGPAALRVHVARGSITTIMAFLFFWGLVRVPMAQAVALTFIAPLLSLALAAVLLGEHVGRRAILASLVAFAGVLVIAIGGTRGTSEPQAWEGTLAIIGSALCYAYNIVLMRRQALQADPREVAFFSHLVLTILFGLAAPWLAIVPAPAQWSPILLAALLATGSLLLLSWAYARAPASRLSASEYSGFLWASLFGWLVFGETVGLATMAGAVLIVIGCVLAARAAQAPPEAAEL